ncbi:hypothetical protein B0H19DRAFT_1270388 [Mycena capillaripes]|nr:hypothetical protein B0H19DRAFT_1270388 [Mycena capillaripes]
MLLFRSIQIACPYDTVPSITANQLAKTLAHSPHLVDYICELWIGRCDAETLTTIVHLPWSRLSTIHFLRGHKKEKTLAVDLITAFVSLPTLHQLSFYRAWDQNDLHTILASCNRGIFNIGFCVFDPPTPYDPPLPSNSGKVKVTPLPPFDALCCRGRQWGGNAINHLVGGVNRGGSGGVTWRHLASLASLSPSPSNSPRLRITHLDLSIGSKIFDFVVHSASPLDLSHLTHLKYGCWSPDAGLPQVLHIASRTIQSLEFWGAGPVVESLDFGSMPALSHITLWSMTAPLVEAIARARTLRTIRFYVSLPEDALQLLNIEAVISAADMPALQRVELRVYGPYKYCDTSTIAQWTSVIKTKVFRAEAVEEPSVLRGTELTKMIGEKMPQLMDRGILFIQISG